MTSSIFRNFGTSRDAEKAGVWVNYGDVKFLVARAGGSNIPYAECLKAKMRPVRHQLDTNSLPRSENDRIMAEVYAETIIKDVQVLAGESSTGNGEVDQKWESGIPTEDGKVVSFSKAAVLKLLLDLPDMFRDLIVCSTDVAKYLKEEDNTDVKN